ncbi:MAG: CapA family protein, partial [Eubacteriales bacterium]
EKGYEWPFSGLYDLLSADDLSVINLEGVLKDDTAGRQEGKLHWFRGPTSFAGILPAGSIELAGLANNHMRDYGIAGHNSTREALKAAGIPYFGYGDTYIQEHQGLKIGFGGIRETIWRQKPGLPGEEIAALKEAGCDYIVYTIHAGKEYSRTHNELQEKIARSIIDAGADIVIGMHPHVVQGIEKYKDGLIVYSLGNFSFGGNLKLTEFDGLAVQVILDFEGRELKETTLKLIPLLTSGTKPANDFRPIPAQGEDKERILELVQNDSPELEIREVMVFKR